MNTEDDTPRPSEQQESSGLTAPAESFYVVGIGASAGGLEALEQFFEQMPRNSRLSFVVVQHLSPDFKSMMDELLSRRTRIPIVRVEDGIEVQPDAIYLMPPRKEMILSGGRLFLTDKDPSQGFALPIDRFLRSLAQDCGSRSIGVILSGTGSDGSRGIREIHEAGGLVVAQSEESARFDGMPRSARETGLVDLVLAPADMPNAILKLVRFRSPDFRRSGDETAVAEVGLHSIFRMLRSEYGIDFSQYKPSTVARRVERRLLLNHSPDVEQYVDRLVENSGELNQLYKDLMIGVTQFFRDREAFHRLGTQELPRILADVQDDQEFRVWVAGCATGEEAYTLAMLIHEQLTALQRPLTVRIFATDAHRASLDFASAGAYSADALSAISPQRREKYFVRKGDGFQVAPHLRKMVLFAPHDVLRDAPFTRLDLVSCRNLLIYLQPGPQKKVLSLFHFGLKAGGVLFLGPSESPGELCDEFESVDEHWKLYRKRRDLRLRPDFRMLVPASPLLRQRSHTSPPGSGASARLQQAVYDRLLEEHLPPSFLINDRRELIHCFGGSGRFLRLRNGRTTSQLLDMIDEELRPILIGALARAEKHMIPVVFTGVRIPAEDGTDLLARLTVKPLPDRISGLTTFLVLLESLSQSAPPREESALDLRAASQEQIQVLEQDLAHTRENLQAMIEEQESSNEELQATNEELVASNEELQSTNEELHSVNEELYTVNAEYQHKIEELTQVTADLENLLLATDVGILFLDHNLCIRRFTPRVGRLFNLLPHDIGRSIAGFTNRLNEPLQESLEQVLQDGRPIEKEIHDCDGNCYFLRILSYRISPAARDGVVLSLIDISPLKKAETRLQHLSAIVECSADAIVGTDPEGRILSWNRGAEVIYGYKAEEVIGRRVRILFPTDSADSFDAMLRSIRAGESFTEEHRGLRRDGTVIHLLQTVSPIRDNFGRVVGASGIACDITARKRAENEIQQAIRNRDHFLAMLSHELRNPLGAIQNAAQVLEQSLLPESAGAACAVVSRQTEQMRTLLDDLLDVARVTQNKIVLRREVCRLSDVLSDAIEAVTPLIDARQQTLQVSAQDSEILVNGDTARLQQVAINLLKNAAKYSSLQAEINVRIHAEGEHAILEIKDHGLGIPTEMLSRIFDLFVQSDETLDRADGGMGVGLTLVKAIVELHGGTVTAASDGPDTGSTFTVRLPRSDHPPLQHSDSDRRVKNDERARIFRIVVVDDNADSRSTLQALLELEGHSVTTAADGPEGIREITASHPEIAIIDIGLPEVDGFEVARRIRATQMTPMPFLAALTGYGFPSDRKKALEAGFDLHLVKPLRRSELQHVWQLAAEKQASENPEGNAI